MSTCFYFHYYDESVKQESKLPISPYPKDPDVERIEKFLQDTQGFLSRLVKHKKAFIDDLHDDVKNAWDAAEKHFTDAIVKLSGVAPETLKEHGLTGAELRLKLRNIQHYFGDLISLRGSNVLGKFFDGINNLLDSIAQALGIQNAMKEIKDAIRDALA